MPESVRPAIRWTAFDFQGARCRLRARQSPGDVAKVQDDQTNLEATEELQIQIRKLTLRHLP